jgi:ribonuclease HII
MDALDAPLSVLTERYLTQNQPCPDAVLKALQKDARAGARKLADRIVARAEALVAEEARQVGMLAFEQKLWDKQLVHVAGTDEVGMGPLAGPCMAAAVILPHDFRARGLNDSKQLDEADLVRLTAEIKAKAVAWCVAEASVAEIDSINIRNAGMLAMKRAVDGLSVKPHALLLDARELPGLAIPQQGIIKGDAKSLTIAAASVLAKTTRDLLMVELDAKYPGYGLAKHKGYPAPDHLAALKKLGPCVLHRRSFAPVREAEEAMQARKQAAPSQP